jgi:hypothetical protein
MPLYPCIYKEIVYFAPVNLDPSYVSFIKMGLISANDYRMINKAFKFEHIKYFGNYVYAYYSYPRQAP